MGHLYDILQNQGQNKQEVKNAFAELEQLVPRSSKKYKQMGIDEFEKKLEQKMEEEREAERQRILRDLKRKESEVKVI
jgi:glutamyl-tRNA reductase